MEVYADCAAVARGLHGLARRGRVRLSSIVEGREGEGRTTRDKTDTNNRLLRRLSQRLRREGGGGGSEILLGAEFSSHASQVELCLPRTVATGDEAAQVYGSEVAGDDLASAGAGAALPATYGTAGFADAEALNSAVAALSALEASAQQSWLQERYAVPL